MSAKLIKIAVFNYPGALQSAVNGFQEIFAMAGNLCLAQNYEQTFVTEIINVKKLDKSLHDTYFSAVILPPGFRTNPEYHPSEHVRNWLLYQHKNGARLCSVCAGAFILAETGLLKGRPATTHWGLAYDLQKQFPDAIINSERILINDGDIVTAGGITAWIDLSLELVALFAGPAIMRLMGKQLIFDTGHREQRYYQSFSPSFSHGDSIMIAAQNFIHENYFHQINIKEIAESICLSEKTLLRRFKKATGMVPINYLQRVRIQKACDFLENSDDSFETICDKVGYVDVSSFRKIFIKTMGLTPREFRKRFAYQSHEIDNSL